MVRKDQANLSAGDKGSQLRPPSWTGSFPLEPQQMRISVMGLGYVGAVAAACLAKDGHEVIGVDPQQTKVDLVNAGRTPIIEQDIGEIIAEQVAAGRLVATTDVKSAVAATDLSLVCVGTPSLGNGHIDLKYIRRGCGQIAEGLREHRGHTVVLRSTLLPGSM